MPRLLALTGVVLIALVGAGSARADHLEPIPPSTASPVVNNTGGTGGVYRTTGATQAAIAVRGYDPLAAPWSPAGTNSIPSTINKMQRAGRILPRMRTVGVLLLQGAFFEAGQKIGDGVGGYIYQKLTGDAYGSDPTDTFGPAPGWALVDTIDTAGGGFPDQPADRWWITRDGLTTTPGAGTYCSYPAGSCAATGSFVGQPEFSTWALLQGGTVVYNTFGVPADGTASCGSSAAGNCQRRWKSEEEMEEETEVEDIDEPTYNALTKKVVTNYPAPGDLGTDADRAASGAVLVAPDGSQTPGQQATEEAICEDLFPGECVREDNIDLPQPQPNETYSDYIARLEALGYIGTATTTEETTALAGYGPEAVTRVRINTTPARVLDPLNWPSVAPAIAPSIALTIRYNPATATPAPTEGGTTPGTATVTGAPTTIPGTPAVDFTPITNLDPGCKFPYGFVCYAVDFTEQFDVSADAPVFSFNLGTDIPLCNDCEAAYAVDLNVMDDYMALWRGILSVVLWVGAIYLVATRLLGFNAGGDPGEAIDDVL